MQGGTECVVLAWVWECAAFGPEVDVEGGEVSLEWMPTVAAAFGAVARWNSGRV